LGSGRLRHVGQAGPVPSATTRLASQGYPWVALHASVDGWVEALALTYVARPAGQARIENADPPDVATYLHTRNMITVCNHDA
jgi:hypothetical protein